MAEQPDQESKTEEPTPKKLADAIEKGNTPYSRELTMFASLIAVLVSCWLVVPGLSARSTAILASTFANVNDWPLATPSDLSRVLFAATGGVALALLPLFAVLAVAGMAGAMVQNPVRMVLERIRPQASRISLVRGWQRLMGLRMLREFVKSLFKFLAAALVCAIVYYSHETIVMQSLMIEPNRIPATSLSLVLSLLSWTLVVLVALAVGDLMWTRWDWFQQQRMTRQELKDEVKQTEGDPLMRMRLRSLARDRSRRRMIADVAKATLVITNPTHFAVAMRYRMEEGGAPRVVAKGQDRIALKIREVAEANGIPIFEDPPLARALYKAVEVDVEIPAEFYVPVAKIVRLLYADKRAV
ncbi:MAG: flagellar biosynthesis protein FlhB [Alphaproteobacteria bacterium]|nr:MAG: flagellar biosynthesis protein FlhB [Alphaproteobacteria bacterium]